MPRFLADIPDDDVRWLDQTASEQGKSRAAVLREAVATYRARADANGDTNWIMRGAGYWKDRTDIGDAVDYQRAMREDRTPYDEL